MTYSVNAIDRMLEGYPNANISITPTPIYKLSRLSSQLGCNLYIMREDMTGFAIGGNKNRKLDYLIGDAIAKGADTLITKKASSFSRNAAAAGRVFGLDVHVLIVGVESEQNAASQALFKQFDTKLHYVKNSEEALDAEYCRVVNDLKNKGKMVYELHPGGSDAIGSLGYINAFSQIAKYSSHSDVHFSHIFHSTGSTATQVGLLLGQSISEYETTVIGIAASQPNDVQRQRIHELAVQTSQILGIPFDESKIIVDDRFIGPGYAVPSKEGEAAAKMFAVTEGVLLDDVYTSKAAAGLVSYAMNGQFSQHDNVLFIHTGGNSGLFY